MKILSDHSKEIKVNGEDVILKAGESTTLSTKDGVALLEIGDKFIPVPTDETYTLNIEGDQVSYGGRLYNCSPKTSPIKFIFYILLLFIIFFLVCHNLF